MKKTIIITTLFITLISIIISCGGDKKESNNTLVLYSPHKEILIDLVVDMYEEETGKDVEVITAGTGELIARLKTESGNPNADVMWGGGMNSFSSETSLFESYASPNEANVENVFKNADGYFTRFSAIPSTIVINTEELAKTCGEGIKIEGYQSIIDLAKTCPDIVGRISNASPTKSSSSFEQLVNQVWAFAYFEYEKEIGTPPVTTEDINQTHLDKAWDHIEKLIAVYDGKHSAGSGAVITDVVQGETAIGLSYEMAAGGSSR